MLCHSNACGLDVLTLIKRSPKLRFEPVSFLFLVCFSLEIFLQQYCVIEALFGVVPRWTQTPELRLALPHSLNALAKAVLNEVKLRCNLDLFPQPTSPYYKQDANAQTLSYTHTFRKTCVNTNTFILHSMSFAFEISPEFHTSQLNNFAVICSAYSSPTW